MVRKASRNPAAKNGAGGRSLPGSAGQGRSLALSGPGSRLGISAQGRSPAPNGFPAREESFAPGRARALPPGRLKIAQALRQLLEQKEFGAITTAEIAKTAGVAEALIYRYFGDKRGLLHQVLKDYLEEYFCRFEQDLKGSRGALDKLRKQIRGHIDVYATNRVFARILLLEVRNYPDYYRSETYELVKKYSNLLLEIIEEGVRAGEIRGDVSPKFLRQVILGGIEHLCLTGVIFQREICPETLTRDFCKALFEGIRTGKR